MEIANAGHSQTIDNLQQYSAQLETAKSESTATIEELQYQNTEFSLLQQKFDVQSAELDQLKELNSQLEEDHSGSIKVAHTLTSELAAAKELKRSKEAEWKGMREASKEV